MADQNITINYAKNKVDQFVLNDENIQAYSLAEEAERVRKAEISYAVSVARDEARNEAREKRNREIVQNMIKANMDISIIKTVTGLSEDVIKSYSI